MNYRTPPCNPLDHSQISRTGVLVSKVIEPTDLSPSKQDFVVPSMHLLIHKNLINSILIINTILIKAVTEPIAILLTILIPSEKKKNFKQPTFPQYPLLFSQSVCVQMLVHQFKRQWCKVNVQILHVFVEPSLQFIIAQGRPQPTCPFHVCPVALYKPILSIAWPA